MDQTINHIIARVLSGEASLDDTLRLSDWLNENAENRKFFSQLKIYWDAEVTQKGVVDRNLLLDKIHEKINRHDNQAKRKHLWRTIVPVAASIAALLAVSYSLVHTYNQKEIVVEQVHEYFTYLTNDNKSYFTLEDGTKIMLNKNSRLTYTDKYGIDNRYVKLDGEAFFEVVKDPMAPFEVAFEIETKDSASIKVLGTVFGVKIDANREKITATLVSGTIQFETKHEKVTMKPNQQLAFTYSNQQIDMRTVDAEEEIAWTYGVLKYKTIAFADLVKELEKVYKVPIIIENPKNAPPSTFVSGGFDEKQTINQVLTVISRSFPIKWRKKDGTYYIRYY